jgi:hypothetical protein
MKTPSETVQAAQPAFPHYFKALPAGCTHVDVYRVLDLFGVTDAPIQHAIKKLLCAGARGAKDQAQDVAEAIATLQRWQQMRDEEQDASDLSAAVDQMREVMGKYCECRARMAGDCPGTWEPGCDMGANEAHAVPAGEDAEAALQQAINLGEFPNLAEFVENAPKVLERYGAKDLNELIDKLKAERAARWANAPAFASDLVQLIGGVCLWVARSPMTTTSAFAGYNLLGRVACEPRPEVQP